MSKRLVAVGVLVFIATMAGSASAEHESCLAGPHAYDPDYTHAYAGVDVDGTEARSCGGIVGGPFGAMARVAVNQTATPGARVDAGACQHQGPGAGPTCTLGALSPGAETGTVLDPTGGEAAWFFGTEGTTVYAGPGTTTLGRTAVRYYPLSAAVALWVDGQEVLGATGVGFHIDPLPVGNLGFYVSRITVWADGQEIFGWTGVGEPPVVVATQGATVGGGSVWVDGEEQGVFEEGATGVVLSKPVGSDWADDIHPSTSPPGIAVCGPTAYVMQGGDEVSHITVASETPPSGACA